jgi:hypothetical protein
VEDVDAIDEAKPADVVLEAEAAADADAVEPAEEAVAVAEAAAAGVVVEAELPDWDSAPVSASWSAVAARWAPVMSPDRTDCSKPARPLPKVLDWTAGSAGGGGAGAGATPLCCPRAGPAKSCGAPAIAMLPSKAASMFWAGLLPPVACEPPGAVSPVWLVSAVWPALVSLTR